MPRKGQSKVPSAGMRQSCSLCQQVDCNEMVRCNNCERWYHFSCVGVNESVANYGWSCKECIAARVPAPPLLHPSTPTAEPLPQPLRPAPRVSTPRTPVLPVPSPRSQTPRTPIVPPASKHTSPSPAPRPRSPCAPVMQSTIPPAPPTIDPDLMSKLPTELRIKLLEEEEALERNFLHRRFQLLLDAGNVNPVEQGNSFMNNQLSHGAREPPVFHSSTMNGHRYTPPIAPLVQNRQKLTFAPCRRDQQLHAVVQNPPLTDNRFTFSTIDPPRTDQRSYIPAREPPPVILRPNTTSSVPSQTENLPYMRSSFPNCAQRPNVSAFAQCTGFPRHTAQESYPYDSYNFPATSGGTTLLNQSQIAARHAVAKELPVFSGDPEEWPLFFATYENTTNLCGFSPEENMARLQKCLRGKALEAVKCQLLHPTNLEHVLSTLKMLFGRPEIIVHMLLKKINDLPAPNAERLGTLIDFALAVRNMVATVKACELEEHLCNLTLLHSLTERLPPFIRLNWATHRQSLQLVTLSDFSDWLYKLAEAASAITMPQFSNTECSKTPRGRRDEGFLNAHTETDRKDTTSAVCVVCSGNCETVKVCKPFISMDLSARWDAVRKHKLCRNCLGNHRGSCRSGKLCGKNGCEYKHDRLMHNDAKDKLVTSSQEPKQQTETLQCTSREAKPCNTRGGSKPVLFQYVPVTLYSNGAKVNTYAFLDSGSSLTLMEESLAKKLNLRGENYPLCLRWTADTRRYEEDAMRVSLDISGTYDGCPKNNLADVYTVKELELPSQSLSMRKLAGKYGYLNGLPIHSYDDVQPKLLIGMNNVHLVHALNGREGMPNEPVAVKTRLGWTIYGTCAPEAFQTSHAALCSYHICFHHGDSEQLPHGSVKQCFNTAEASLNVTEIVEEIRPSILHHTEGRVRTTLLRQNFSWNRSRRSTAFVLRFVNNIRLKKHDQQMFNKRAQEEVYADELAVLATGNRRLHKKNSLFNLSSFIDVQGVMRINSRLSECDFLDENNKYSIVLPRNHSTPVVHNVHLRYLYQRLENGVNEARLIYHIPRVHKVYDRVQRESQGCKLLRAAPVPTSMSCVSKCRLTAFMRPFSYVTYEFFGPLLVVVNRHHKKRWGVIITCLTTKATKGAASLNISSCVFALRNYFEGRSTLIEIVSDRVINPLGADIELKEAVMTLDKDKLTEEFTMPRISWLFNSLVATHIWGRWERLIQSVMSDDYSSPAFTSNYFLLGSSHRSKPQVQYCERPSVLQCS